MIRKIARKIARKTVRKILDSYLASINGMVLIYSTPRGYEERQRVVNLIKQTRGEVEMLLSDNEAYQIYMCVKQTAKVPGAIAEVGCYKGASSKLICEAKGERRFYVFDTFEGLPKLNEKDDKKQFFEGRFASSLEAVRKVVSPYSNVSLHKGLFPKDTGHIVQNERFSFVHMDVDLYESTLQSLRFFYPRMSNCGVILSHDYQTVSGVKKAFDEFFQDKPEVLIEMSGTQVLAIKS